MNRSTKQLFLGSRMYSFSPLFLVCTLFFVGQTKTAKAAPIPTPPHAGFDIHLHPGPFTTVGVNSSPLFIGNDGTNNPADGWHWEHEIRNPGLVNTFPIIFKIGSGAGTVVRAGRLKNFAQFARANFDFHIPDQGNLGETGTFLALATLAGNLPDLEWDVAVTEPPVLPPTNDVVPPEWEDVPPENLGGDIYIITIPEPTTLSLLALGGFVLTRRRRTS